MTTELNNAESPLSPGHSALEATNPPEEEESGVLESSTPAPPDLSTLLQRVSKRHVVDMTRDDMDPLEWTFRKIVPIPEEYYWEVAATEEQLSAIPTSIKLWHKTIAGWTAAYRWTEDKIGKPLVRATGLTSPRFYYVTDQMTEEDWERSRRNVMQRRSQRSEEMRDRPLETVEVKTDVEDTI